MLGLIKRKEEFEIIHFCNYSTWNNIEISWTMILVILPLKLFGQWVLLPFTTPNRVRIS